MKFTVLLVLISSIVMVSDSTLIIAGIIAVKAAIVAGFVAGGIAGGIIGSAARRNRGFGGRPHRRYGRAVGSVDEMFLSASQSDADDCAKKLICSLAARNPATLAEDESVISSLFGNGDLDVSKSTVEFDLAAIMGRRVGVEQCSRVYARCVHSPATLMEVMRSADFNNF